MIAKPSPRMAEPMADVDTDAANRPARSRLPFGSSPISIVPRPSMPIVPNSCISLIAVLPQPTSSGENSRAAAMVNTKPNSEVMPVVAARLPAFLSRSWFCCHMPCIFDDSPELCWSFMAVSGYLPSRVQVAGSRVGVPGPSPPGPGDRKFLGKSNVPTCGDGILLLWYGTGREMIVKPWAATPGTGPPTSTSPLRQPDHGGLT